MSSSGTRFSAVGGSSDDDGGEEEEAPQIACVSQMTLLSRAATDLGVKQARSAGAHLDGDHCRLFSLPYSP